MFWGLASSSRLLVWYPHSCSPANSPFPFSLILILYFPVSLSRLNSARFYILSAFWLWLITTYPKRTGFWAPGLLSGKGQANGQGDRAGDPPRLSCPRLHQMWSQCWYQCFVGQLSLSLRHVVSTCNINTAQYGKYVKWEIVENIWNLPVPLWGIWAIFCWKLTRTPWQGGLGTKCHVL